MSNLTSAFKLNRIVHGDSREKLKALPTQTVQLVVTSPPYWNIKDYRSNHQIGFHDSYPAYIHKLNDVWKECYRVLYDGCKLCINVGDIFSRSEGSNQYKVIPIREAIIRGCERIGFDYLGAIIWQKITNTHSSGGGALMGSYPFPRNGIVKIDYEFILIFKKPGKAPEPTNDQKEKCRIPKDAWKLFFSGHWYFPGIRQGDHPAMFPEELPVRLIRMFSFVGETVLDPFIGSGTTGIAARLFNRNFVGYDTSRKYCRLARKRIKSAIAEKSEMLFG